MTENVAPLSIDFSNGFNVITGETGAGKSILIKALQLILGGKAASSVVRKEAKLASVAACFEVANNHLAFDVLENLGIVSGTIWAEARQRAGQEQTNGNIWPPRGCRHLTYSTSLPGHLGPSPPSAPSASSATA